MHDIAHNAALFLLGWFVQAQFANEIMPRLRRWWRGRTTSKEGK